ncbi:KRE1 domain-containing protein CYBJADRAFT_86317 [Cyberlindnera jadinii NRRL Y-1542]|uniref:Uncharacterized protein n=1 Tax=Cyberlindnera jadinii (strain ATCC 18201 / CBS 1600 / BCRC 20928 / JCM 3617 / NBRC 0987 / NRRL Y-1542) TaxID=983966 RepID=A0A1E4S221_CYBJN|nr:hypothetical protein CYBJADRAFT_86317 [Cyberlindnera jadinii NRRL Y-1542]ODV73556.1 hypothetical protein CYBJADRAFT_86317 [Cyberlindnera jadinii NRRL Y-1542]
MLKCWLFTFSILFALSFAQREVTIITVITSIQDSTTQRITTDSVLTQSPTYIWATGTDAAGVLQTTQSAYSQQFTRRWSTVASVPTGTIGLGTLEGTIGTVRTYPKVTVTSNF